MMYLVALLIGDLFAGLSVYYWIIEKHKADLYREKQTSWRDGWNQAMTLAEEDGWKTNKKKIKPRSKKKSVKKK